MLRDRQRAKKTYPFIRVPPRIFVDAGDFSQSFIEVGVVSFANESSKTYTFAHSFPSVPTVVITAVDSVPNGQANVNTYISSVSIGSVTFETSAPFTGQIHFDATYKP